MAPVNGRPFLLYLIEQLRDQGIDRFVLLTGYRGETVREYFSDGRDLGVAITYSEGPAEWETARRVAEATHALEARFLLLYSDNYVPVDIANLVDLHESRHPAITLLLSRKKSGNIRVDGDGHVVGYDPTRTAPNLEYVEIGYMVVERDAILPLLEPRDQSFSRVLVRLASEGRLAGLVTGDAYHSISDLQRWKLAEQYLADKRILLIDRDGTINERAPRGEYVGRWKDFRWVPDTVEAMRLLSAAGFRFIVLSNQAGIGRGVLTADQVSGLNERMRDALAAEGIEILDMYVCPHRWEDGCDCRKPAPGMFFRAAREHLVRLDRTIYIGDDPRDALAAHNAGCISLLVGPERDIDPGAGAAPAATAETLEQLVPWIVARFEAWESHAGARSTKDVTLPLG